MYQWLRPGVPQASCKNLTKDLHKAADKYDMAILVLTAAPDFKAAAVNAWGAWSHNPGGELFKFMSRDGNYSDGVSGTIGCLTMIKGGHCKSLSPILDNLIAKDIRIPSSPGGITPESLPVFAEYQRLADSMFRQEDCCGRV